MCLPIKLFWPKDRRVADVKFPISLGILPSKWFADKEILRSSLHFHRLWGIEPLSRLPDKKRPWRAGRVWHILSGRWPVRLLYVKSILVSEERLKIGDGMGPIRAFSESSNISRFRRLPSSCGISPVNYEQT